MASCPLVETAGSAVGASTGLMIAVLRVVHPSFISFGVVHSTYVDEDRSMRAVEDLIAEVRDPRSREHFAEAVRAYGAGAYRAAM